MVLLLHYILYATDSNMIVVVKVKAMANAHSNNKNNGILVYGKEVRVM